MTLRNFFRKFTIIRRAYQYLMLAKRLVLSWLKKLNLFLFHRREYALLAELRQKVRALYPTNLNIKNTGEFPYFYFGKNFLGYPGMSFLEKDGVNVGMSEGRLTSGEANLPIIQLKTDMEVNFKNLFEKFRPAHVVDFGTSSGGSAVFFYEQMEKYTQPRLMTIDISDQDFNNSANFHREFRTKEKIETILNKSSVDCGPEVKQFLASRKPGDKVLFSFDDLHTYEHTYNELITFAPLLQSGDVILMQDTWNQGLLGHETSPMLAVYRFLEEDPSFYLDEIFCKQMVLPCNFIFGVIIKK